MAKVNTKHEELGLSREQMQEMYYWSLLHRRVDERLWLLQRGGKIPFVISGQGAEPAQAAMAMAFRKDHDWVCPYYRDLGVVLAMGMTPEDVFLGAFARAGDPSSGGKQMAHHWAHRAHNIVSTSSPVTTQFLHAVGVAHAAKIKGDDIVVYTCCGEGSTNQGDFHEALNWAGVHKLPVIFVVQNNKYAISVPLDQQLSCEHVADRAVGYGIPGVTVDGKDPLEVYRVTKEAVDRARRGEGPTLIEVEVERLTAHSSDDNDKLYRSKEEIEAMKQNDPLYVFRNYLKEHGLLTDDEEKAMEERVAREVDEGCDRAEKAPYPAPEEALTHVYKQA
jgi:2-oxoisovalerate dehydrogenase E1 component alpha subunit